MLEAVVDASVDADIEPSAEELRYAEIDAEAMADRLPPTDTLLDDVVDAEVDPEGEGEDVMLPASELVSDGAADTEIE